MPSAIRVFAFNYGGHQWQWQEPAWLWDIWAVPDSPYLTLQFSFIDLHSQGQCSLPYQKILEELTFKFYLKVIYEQVGFDDTFSFIVHFGWPSHYLFHYSSHQLSALKILQPLVLICSFILRVLYSPSTTFKLRYELMGFQVGFHIHFLWVSSSHYL